MPGARRAAATRSATFRYGEPALTTSTAGLTPTRMMWVNAIGSNFAPGCSSFCVTWVEAPSISV
ncbi:hypothetical protein D3C72_2496240 [compost metagenome]